MTVMLLLIIISLDAAVVFGTTNQIPDKLISALKGLILLGVLGTAITAVAMEYFLFTYDASPTLSKVFWFFAMFFLLLGPPLYCFLVYSRAELFRNRAAAHGAASS